jgi:hypothetical protein
MLGGGAITDGTTDAKNASGDGPLLFSFSVKLLHVVKRISIHDVFAGNSVSLTLSKGVSRPTEAKEGRKERQKERKKEKFFKNK